ncbi:hypothetical protein Ancab_006171 [Ancistrocladus abbreviatus]
MKENWWDAVNLGNNNYVFNLCFCHGFSYKPSNAGVLNAASQTIKKVQRRTSQSSPRSDNCSKLFVTSSLFSPHPSLYHSSSSVVSVISICRFRLLFQFQQSWWEEGGGIDVDNK